MWSILFLSFVVLHHQIVTAKLRKLKTNMLPYINRFYINVADVIRKCSRSVENINECICESIELLRDNLANGDFGEDFVIPKLEPLYIDEININRRNDYNEMVFRNLFVSGPSQFVLKNMR